MSQTTASRKTDTPTAASSLRERIRLEIVGMVQDELTAVWHEELTADAKRKVKRLNHDLKEPDALAPWRNLATPAARTAPPISAMLEAENRNELGDAELLRARQAGKYVYDHKACRWMRFDGVIWKDDVVHNAQQLPMTDLAELYEQAATRVQSELEDAKAVVETKLMKHQAELDAANDNGDAELSAALQKTISDQKEKLTRMEGGAKAKKRRLIERAKRLRGKQRAKNVISTAAEGDESLGISGEEWETHPLLFACANGVVDLESGRLIKSSPGLFLNKTSPLPYIGLMQSTGWWEDHLRKVFCEDERLVDYFEHAVGYSVTGLRTNKDIWCAYGPQANNGKSATFNSIKAAVGDYATTIKVDMLLDDGKADKGPDPDLMVIDGLRMGLASEAGDRARFSIERIKAVTGGDDVRARGLYADSRIIRSFAKLWLHTNTIPKMSGYDPGFMLRLKVVPFLARFTTDPGEVDEAKHIYPAMDQETFRRRMQAEAPYILAWILRCARKFCLNPHYATPEVIRQYTKSYFEEEDDVGQFLSRETVASDGDRVQAKELYTAFKKFCMEELGVAEKYVKSMKALARELSTHGIEKSVSNKVYYLGLRLRSNLE